MAINESVLKHLDDAMGEYYKEILSGATPSEINAEIDTNFLGHFEHLAALKVNGKDEVWYRLLNKGFPSAQVAFLLVLLLQERTRRQELEATL